MKSPLRFAGFALACLSLFVFGAAHAAQAPALKTVLFCSKSSGFEHDAIKADGKPGHGYAFKVPMERGAKDNIEFTFSKDGSLFTPEYLAQFDA